ncbi:hypothetical protein [Algoriphagus namhaensis]
MVAIIKKAIVIALRVRNRSMEKDEEKVEKTMCWIDYRTSVLR